MEIGRVGNSINIQTIEEQKQPEIDKAKVTVNPQTLDRYEDGASSHVSKDYSSSPEPALKTDVYASQLLKDQMLQARLGGQKTPITQNEQSGRIELNSNQQNAALIREPQIPTGGSGSAGGDQATSQGLKDYMAKHGLNSSGGSGTGGTSSGGGSVSTAAAGEYGQKVKDAMGGLQQNPQGGASGAMAGLTSKVDQQRGFTNTAQDLRAKLHAQVQDAISYNGGAAAGHNYSQDMFADKPGGAGYQQGTYKEGEGLQNNGGKTAQDNPKLNNAVNETYVNGGSGSNREWALLASQDDFNPRDYYRSDGTRVQTGTDGTEVRTAKDGTKTVVKDGTTTTLYPDGSTKTTTPDGKTETTKPKEGTQEGYESGQSQRMRDQMQQLGQAFGINPWETPISSGTDSGNVDGKESVDKGDLSTNVFVQAGGMTGMVGQGRTGDSDAGGGGFHLNGQTGGAIDMQDGSGSSAENKTEDPADVNTNIGGAKLNMADRNSDDDEDTTTTTGKG